MKMHATHYLIYILYDMTSNTVAKVAHSFEMSKYEGRKEKAGGRKPPIESEQQYEFRCCEMGGKPNIFRKFAR